MAWPDAERDRPVRFAKVARGTNVAEAHVELMRTQGAQLATVLQRVIGAVLALFRERAAVGIDERFLEVLETERLPDFVRAEIAPLPGDGTGAVNVEEPVVADRARTTTQMPPQGQALLALAVTAAAVPAASAARTRPALVLRSE